MTQANQHDRLAPLSGLPVHQDLAEWLGYAGGARFVALVPNGEEIDLLDGRIEIKGEAEVWRAYAAHPSVRPMLDCHPEGAQLLLDRRLGTLHRGPAALVDRFLKEQWMRAAQARDSYSTGEFERTLNGLKKAVELLGDTSIQARLDRKELQRRRLEELQSWLKTLA